MPPFYCKVGQRFQRLFAIRDRQFTVRSSAKTLIRQWPLHGRLIEGGDGVMSASSELFV